MTTSKRRWLRAPAAAFVAVTLVACGDTKTGVNDTTTTVAPVPTEGPSFATTSTTLGVTSTIITVPPTVPPPPTTCKPCNVSTVPPPPSTNKDGSAVTTAVPGGTGPTTTAPAHQTYVVKPGDNLGSIAATFHTTTAALVALNHLASADSIYPGQVLTVS